jgi:hypothetical protein
VKTGGGAWLCVACLEADTGCGLDHLEAARHRFESR